MARPRIKFKCYQCNQLLAIVSNRAGATVVCPKCAAELVVPAPEPEQENKAPDESTTTQVLAVDPGSDRDPAAETGIPLELLDIRPEDIQVVPGHRLAEPAKSRARTVPKPPPAAAHNVHSAGSFELPTILGISAPEQKGEPAVPDKSAGSDLPEIDLDRPIPVQRPFIATVSQPRDLMIPRSLVTLWSLFVLFALALSFLAGLLAGHFVWKVHE
jgi:hypothetical protein